MISGSQSFLVFAFRSLVRIEANLAASRRLSSSPRSLQVSVSDIFLSVHHLTSNTAENDDKLDDLESDIRRMSETGEIANTVFGRTEGVNKGLLKTCLADVLATAQRPFMRRL